MQTAGTRDQTAAAFQRVLDAGIECSGAQREWAGRVAASRFLADAQALLRAGGQPRDALPLVQAGLGLGTLWQLMALRGDLRQRIPGPAGPPDYAAASVDYQAALNLINDGDPAADPVPGPVIARLWNKAAQTRLLAARMVPSPPTRAGTPGGLALPSIRSFVPTSVPVPVQFVFDSTTPTPAGAQAAEELAKELETAGRPAVLLVGHADRQGADKPNADAYNVDLSRRRAEAMRQYLIARRYPPERLRVEGHGCHDPLPIEDADGYTEEERFQMHRRMEVRRQ